MLLIESLPCCPMPYLQPATASSEDPVRVCARGRHATCMGVIGRQLGCLHVHVVAFLVIALSRIIRFLIQFIGVCCATEGSMPNLFFCHLTTIDFQPFARLAIRMALSETGRQRPSGCHRPSGHQRPSACQRPSGRQRPSGCQRLSRRQWPSVPRRHPLPSLHLMSMTHGIWHLSNIFSLCTQYLLLKTAALWLGPFQQQIEGWQTVFKSAHTTSPRTAGALVLQPDGAQAHQTSHFVMPPPTKGRRSL